MKHISVLIKPASSLCNLRCKYCFYADVSSHREVISYGKMKVSIMEQMITNIFTDLDDGDELTIAFQGGEPTLAGLDFYKRFIECIEQQIKKVRVHYRMQTNGTLINEQWCRIFKKYEFLVGLSVDGNQISHDLNRIDTRGRGTFWKVMKTKRMFDEYGIEYNILCVLTEQLAATADKVYRFIEDNDIKFIQFIPCLGDLNNTNRSEYELRPEAFSRFYIELFGLWLTDLKQGKYTSIKLFDDLINLYVNGQVTACGIIGNCQVQYVIEADGSVYPCDFYVLDEYRMGYIQENTLRELFEKDISFKFLCDKPALEEYCDSCPFIDSCQGGCKRMKDAVYVADTGDFCGYQSLLKTFLPRVKEIFECFEGCL